MKLSKIIDYYIGSWALDYIVYHSSEHMRKTLNKKFYSEEEIKNAISTTTISQSKYGKKGYIDASLLKIVLKR